MNKILRERLTRTLGKNRGKSALAHIHVTGNVRKHKIGVGIILRHVKLCLVYYGRHIIRNVAHFTNAQNQRTFILSFHEKVTDMSCGFKALKNLFGFFYNFADSDTDFAAVRAFQFLNKRSGHGIGFSSASIAVSPRTSILVPTLPGEG